ncbi:RecQ family ATP-dependent DNA helicase [Lipingzhangella sp. LS1_29]|uniref:DNA 3'-5' helicase n=1 Tax=Lipingzhangella rawalii TaxID=2055835 RepID=A0ABU2H768_9ACTN|nr:RecQ family ATP-dependent DNA helicase [Lipingzhangella rawalii]MDS1271156.1 RecQ family ATP-dependent DNA helicase [Lipingzhangella rawalii]
MAIHSGAGLEPDTGDAQLRLHAEQHLRALAGPHAELRDDQWWAIHALVVDRRRALVVQRTGWGKSAVYFVATALLRARGAGPTVIVSPLLALMRNQIAAAEQAGIQARTINSANLTAWDEIYTEIIAGAVDLLLVSPERLNHPDFVEKVLPPLSSGAGLVVVDEAHCISDWGHDFRPDYRRIRSVLAELPSRVPVLATTATANARVTEDVAEQLGGGDAEPPLVLRGALDRKSLHLSVVRLPDTPTRLAWLATHLCRLPGAGIVYTLTVAAASEAAEFLAGRGYRVRSYSGQSDAAERQQVEDELLANQVDVVVATSALGMGFDKPDLGFVVHLGAPQSPIAYYQQVGRAGRGVQRAEVVLLPSEADPEIWEYFTTTAIPAEETVRQVLDTLNADGEPWSLPRLETQVNLNRARLEQMLKILDVDGAVRRQRGGWTATGRPWTYDTQRYAAITAARRREQQAMLDYISTSACRLEYLRRQLDDPELAPCGRCDNCVGSSWTAGTDPQHHAAAEAFLDRPGVAVHPRRQWPIGMPTLGVQLSGRIPGQEQASTGRALTRLTGLGWARRVRELLATDAPDQPVDEDVFQAVVRVLADWQWEHRPVGVVAMPSLRRARLVHELARRVAQLGRLTFLGSLGYTTPAGVGPRRGNSALRLADLTSAVTVPEPTCRALAAVSGPVLLVDDYMDTGWTMTVGARLARQAGAAEVLPLVLAARG